MISEHDAALDYLKIRFGREVKPVSRYRFLSKKKSVSSESPFEYKYVCLVGEKTESQ